MSPEFGMASAMFSVLVLPPLLFMLSLVGGIIAGFVLDRFYGEHPRVMRKDVFLALGLVCAVAVMASASMVFTAPPLGMTFPVITYVALFVTCALVSFWHNVGKNRRTTGRIRTDKRMFSMVRPARDKVFIDVAVRNFAGVAPVKMKLEIRPDEDMTVVVVYSAKDGSFANREIFSAEAKKDQRYVWEIDIPRISGTATVYLVTDGTGSWAGSKDYEF